MFYNVYAYAVEEINGCIPNRVTAIALDLIHQTSTVRIFANSEQEAISIFKHTCNDLIKGVMTPFVTEIKFVVY